MAISQSSDTVLRRLGALVPLDVAAQSAIRAATLRSTFVPRGQDIVREGTAAGAPRLLIDGWAVCVRLFRDGRRQFLSFLLPGDVIGQHHQPRPLAPATITTLTPVVLAPAPEAHDLPTLAEAYATSKAIEEAYLLEHIARLGRLTALERIVSLMLEFNERLLLSGQSCDDAFTMPITQEQLADSLGLTAVHTNRMLQQARREGLLSWTGGRVTLPQAAATARMIARAELQVSAALPI